MFQNHNVTLASLWCARRNFRIYFKFPSNFALFHVYVWRVAQISITTSMEKYTKQSRIVQKENNISSCAKEGVDITNTHTTMINPDYNMIETN